MTITPPDNPTGCINLKPLFFRPAAVDILTPGSRANFKWLVPNNYSHNFSLTLDLKSLRGSYSERVLNDISVPSYPSTVHVFGTDLMYVSYGVICGYRLVSVNYTMPPPTEFTYSDPNYLISAYSHGLNFSDVFSSDVFQIGNNTSGQGSNEPVAPQMGLTAEQWIPIAVVISIIFFVMMIGMWDLHRKGKKTHDRSREEGTGDDIGPRLLHGDSVTPTRYEANSSEVFEVQDRPPMFELESSNQLKSVKEVNQVVTGYSWDKRTSVDR